MYLVYTVPKLMAASISFICYSTNWILSERETFSVQIIRSLGCDPSNIEDRVGIIDVVLVFLVLTSNMFYSSSVFFVEFGHIS